MSANIDVVIVLDKSSAITEMGDCLATIDSEQWGAAMSLSTGGWVSI